MDDRSGWFGRLGALLNEGGPWGGKGSGPGGGGGSGGGNGGGPKNPWELPPGGGRGRPRGPTALDELLKRGRQQLGGGGGRFPSAGEAQKWLPYALLGFVLLWVAFTSIHRIGPQEEGVITRFGKYAGDLSPGVGFTFPAPIDRVQKVDVQAIRTIDVPQGGGNAENLVLTGDQNIVDLAYSVRWDVRDPQLYLFQLAEPEETIAEVAESAMRAVMGTVSLNDAIGAGRGAIEGQVAQRMQELLDDYRSGVKIQGIAIKQADPPAAVNDAFKRVSAAQQEAQTYINQANAYAQQITAKAQGEAAAFDKVYEEYRLAPEVTRRRMYYETMEEVLSKVDKTIVEPGGVTPYLPLNEVQRRTQTPAPAPGAAK